MGSVPPKGFMPQAPYGASQAANSINPTQAPGLNAQTPLLPPGFTDPGSMQKNTLNPTVAATNPLNNTKNPFGNIFGNIFGKMLLFLLTILCPCSAFATTTVTGHLVDLGTVNAPSGTFVRFTLRGCSGYQPTVPGQGALVPTQGANWFKDFAADSNGNVSGTIYSTRDAAGTGNGDIQCGQSFTSDWYGMTIWQAGKSGPEISIHAKIGAVLDVTSVTPITAIPVVTPPTGDNTYARLDSGNQPFLGQVGASSLNISGVAALLGNLTATAGNNNINACAFNGMLFVGQSGCFAGSDIGAQINAAYASSGCPSYGCTIYVLPPPSGTCYAQTTSINFSTVGKFVNLIGISPADNSNGTTDTGACLNWQSSSGTAITIDWASTGGGAPSGGGITNITFWDNSCTTNGGCGNTANGISIGPVNGGASGARFDRVKLRGFGSGVIMNANGNVLNFPMTFNNFIFQQNTIGVNSNQASEGLNFDTGLFIQNGTGYSQNAANTQIKFDEVHWDGNTAAGFTGSGCTGGVFTFVANHFENNGATTTHYVSCGSLGDLLFEGGLAVDDKSSSSTDFWFNAGNMVGNLKVASVGETVTNLFVSNMLCMSISNGSPAILTGVANGMNCGGAYKNSAASGVLFASGTAPTISSGFGTAPSIAGNGTFAITVNVGTGGTATNGVIGMPTAATAWVCTVNNQTAANAHRADNTRQKGSTTTSVTIENQTTSTGAAVAWTASDIILLSCWGT